MTSSGTYAYSLSNGEALRMAFERAGVRSPSLRQPHFQNARTEMNLMFSEWSNKQVNIWKTELITLTLVDGTATYDVPGRVVMILDAYLTLNNGDTDQVDRYVTPIGRSDYASYAAKFTAGLPTTYYFERTISPTITIWPVIDSSDYVLNYYACVQLQDVSLPGGETPDIPYLWNDAFVAGMAHRMARIYSPQLEDKRKMDAVEAWNIAATQNVENVNLKIQPNIGRYYR